MSIHVALNHVTHYRYDRPCQLGPQVVRLRPAPHCRTPILSYSLRGRAGGHFINWQQDPFANYLARLVFPEKTTEFKVTVDLVAEMSVYNPFDFFLEPTPRKIPSPTTPNSLRRAGALPGHRAGHAAFAAYLASIDRTKAHDRLPGRPEPAAAARTSIT
jgi:transglutaminase-like putative cysteine protease